MPAWEMILITGCAFLYAGKGKQTRLDPKLFIPVPVPMLVILERVSYNNFPTVPRRGVRIVFHNARRIQKDVMCKVCFCIMLAILEWGSKNDFPTVQ